MKPKNLPHFPIRNNQAVSSLFCPSYLRKISGCKEHTPEIFNTLIDFLIGEIQAKFLFNYFPSNQALDFIFCCFISLIDKSLYQIIATRIDPICLRFSFWIILGPVHKVDNIPWTINIRFSETVAIVPFFHFPESIFKMIV